MNTINTVEHHQVDHKVDTQGYSNQQHSAIFISQNTAATQFGCGGMFNDYCSANFLDSMPVKELWKLVNILEKLQNIL